MVRKVSLDRRVDGDEGDDVPASDWYHRPAARSWRTEPASGRPAAFHRDLPGYHPTRLVETPELAGALGVGRVFVKDESERLGLPAFKILGVSWAVAGALAADAGGPAGLAGLRAAAAARPVELVTATDGNHGWALARMAALVGLPATVFLAAGVSAATRRRIAAEGAAVRATDTPYDDAVVAAARHADHPGRLLIQDTAWPGYEQIPRSIVAGYDTLLQEVDAQLAEQGAPAPDLVAVPVGVGSLAQAVTSHYRSGPSAPAVLGVEPTAAAALLTSLRAGEPRTVAAGRTVMTGLNCGTPSSLAWPVLAAGMDAAVAVTDDDAARAAADLARLGVPAGPCGGAALAGVRAALTPPERRAALALPESAVLVLLSTEGAAAVEEERP